MAFYTESELRALEISASATEVPEAVSEVYTQEAIDELTEICGASAVAEVTAAAGTSELKVRQFRKAQRLIFKAKILIWHASRYRSGGVQKSEKDLNDSSVNTYESMEKAREESDALMTEARAAVKPYLLIETPGEPAFAVGVELTDCCRAVYCDV